MRDPVKAVTGAQVDAGGRNWRNLIMLAMLVSRDVTPFPFAVMIWRFVWMRDRFICEPAIRGMFPVGNVHHQDLSV